MTPTVVVACSGPSLDPDRVLASGHPVCAVSTAIRAIPDPDYWVHVDPINGCHGEEGVAAFTNPQIRKVTRYKHRGPFLKQGAKGYEFCPISSLDGPAYEFMARPTPFLRGYNQSVLLAVQWLILSAHFKTLIFAGCDLSMDRGAWWWLPSVPTKSLRRAPPRPGRDTIKTNLKHVERTLREWTPIAQKHGIRFVTWSPGPTRKFMETDCGDS